MSKELKALERIKRFYPQWRLLNRNDFDLIETALKNYKELISIPAILCERTHGNAQALIDYICKTHKEVKITNLEDEKKLKALEIIKERQVNVDWLLECESVEEYNESLYFPLTQDEYDLLKEVLLCK